MYSHNQPQLGSLAAVDPWPWINRFQFVEAQVSVTGRNAQGRLTTSPPRITGPMSQDKRARFIKRFISPMMTHDRARQLLVHVNRSPHPVAIAWGNGNFGFNGTIPVNRTQAVGGRGSGAIVVIDESAPDLNKLPTLRENPDVLLFHELLHVRHSQRGTVVNDEPEMERRVIGLGPYSDAVGTENYYRQARGLSRRCCRAKESLQGLEGYPSLAEFTLGRAVGPSVAAAVVDEVTKEMIAAAARGGSSDANDLTDRLFFARHPDRKGKLIDPQSEPALAQEWKRIRDGLVRPILAAVAANEKGKQAMYAGQYAQAVGHFDRARRVAVAPVSVRAAATLNLGLANLSRQHLAAAIGYFEVVRAIPGVSDTIRDKADKYLAQAKQAYRQAVP